MTTATEEQRLGLGDDPDLLLGQVGDTVQVGVEVNGESIDPGWTATSSREACKHGAVVNVQTLVGFVKGDDNGVPVTDWQVRLRARCAECGVPFEVDPTGWAPRDGGPGVSLRMRPIPE